MIGDNPVRFYTAFATLPDTSPVEVRVCHDPGRRMWGAYAIIGGKPGPVCWAISGDAAARRAVADGWMDSIQVRLPWGENRGTE